MKRILLACFLAAASSAYCNPLIEAKAGYFFFIDSPMQEIFNQGGLDLQVSGSYPIWRGLHVYGSVEWLQKSGSSHGRKTDLWEVPISAGLKPVFPITCHLEYYFTLGPRLFFVGINDHYHTGRRHQSRAAFGGFLNSGLLFNFDSGFTLDLFGEYSYGKASFHNGIAHGKSVQVGGLTFGLGLGYTF
jgi:hypothetical protein